jgi:hypothetical protein
MKKISLITLMSLSFISCKKEVQPTEPTPAGPCHCGEILQGNVSNGTLTVKNYCSGNILTFQVGLSWYSNPQEDYCQAVAW